MKSKINCFILLLLVSTTAVLAQIGTPSNTDFDNQMLKTDEKLIKGIVEFEFSSNSKYRQAFSYEWPINRYFSLEGGLGITHRNLLYPYDQRENYDVTFKPGAIANVSINYYLLHDAPRDYYVGLGYFFQNFRRTDENRYNNSSGLIIKIRDLMTIYHGPNARVGYQLFIYRCSLDFFVGTGMYYERYISEEDMDRYVNDDIEWLFEGGIKVGYIF